MYNYFTSSVKYRLLSLYQRFRIVKYRLFSDNNFLSNDVIIYQPVLAKGCGIISLGKCFLGVRSSAYNLNGYIYLEVRSESALIQIEDGVWINNNAVISVSRSSVKIGANTLIGTGFTAYDSDGHDIHPDRRNSGSPICADIVIGKNVFIGSGVTILKGVTIGDDAVIGAGSIVTKNVPTRVIVAGNPACKIRDL